jgi:pimeloyl-ACP methyl ester carboxylesterase
MTFTQSETRPFTMERGGTTLTAEIRPGQGTPILVVPGVMADAATWRSVVAAIDLPNPVVTINRRGRSPSGGLGADYSVRVEIDDLRRTIDSLGAVHLVGWSYGALIALETAIGCAAVRSLTAYEPVGAPFAPDAVDVIRAATAVGDLDRAVELVNTAVSGFSEDYVAELRRTPAWPVLRQLAEPLGEELAAINDYRPSWKDYARLQIPVTLILGARNENLAPYGTAFAPFAAALAHSRVARLPDQGHLAHVEAPAELAAAIATAVGQAEGDG